MTDLRARSKVWDCITRVAPSPDSTGGTIAGVESTEVDFDTTGCFSEINKENRHNLVRLKINWVEKKENISDFDITNVTRTSKYFSGLFYWSKRHGNEVSRHGNVVTWSRKVVVNCIDRKQESSRNLSLIRIIKNTQRTFGGNRGHDKGFLSRNCLIRHWQIWVSRGNSPTMTRNWQFPQCYNTSAAPKDGLLSELHAINSLTQYD